jgi:TonB-dependent starch-binding outer membrane protein SusC
MLRSSSLVLLPVGLVIGLLSGCAHAPGWTPTIGPEAQSGPGAQVVTAEDIQRVPPGQSIEKLLMGRAPGVIVGRTADGGISVRIRGPASFYASGEPLYVLDGSPIEAGPGGALSGINPWDIESIRVLKNPGDTAIYGMRGVNGVIVITTRGSH